LHTNEGALTHSRTLLAQPSAASATTNTLIDKG
jgi:hypothetical protein